MKSTRLGQIRMLVAKGGPSLCPHFAMFSASPANRVVRLLRTSKFLAICCVLLFGLLPSVHLNARYFRNGSFRPYEPRGLYPRWRVVEVNLNPRVSLDGEGIPVVQYPAGRFYNPVTVAYFGLRAYNRWKISGNMLDREYFLKTARWLVAHQDPASGCWHYDFDWVSVGETIPKPWISGMAQGLAISNLTRAYYATSETAFLKAAERALWPFQKSVEEGGVAQPIPFLPAPEGKVKLVFYEEYPTRPAPSCTLNGFMFALLGLYDLAQVPNAEAAQLFEKGLATLRAILPLYDLGDGSAYDLGHLTHPPRRVKADQGYHLIHISLLKPWAAPQAIPSCFGIEII